MFRKSAPTTNPDLFSQAIQFLDKPRLDTYQDPNAWHNLFHRHVTSCIDEAVFQELFQNRMGAPNAPIRQLVALMILKQGHGWSDQVLFEQGQFNLLVRQALGLHNLSDVLPCPATYYNFKRALYEHYQQTGKDLMGEVFSQLTADQARYFGVSGEYLRMDSTLIGSNIAACTRLQLLLGVLAQLGKELKQKGRTANLPGPLSQRLDELTARTPTQQTWTMNEPDKQAMLEQLGSMMQQLVHHLDGVGLPACELLRRALAEHYRTGDQGQLELIPAGELASDRMQSVHDPQASFRSKGGNNKGTGYSVNLSETCNESGLNLITDVRVNPAIHSDSQEMAGAVKRSMAVVGPIDNVHADGSYQSPENLNFTGQHGIEPIFSGVQGNAGSWRFRPGHEGSLWVEHLPGALYQMAVKIKSGSWRVRNPQGQYRYFTPDQVRSAQLREYLQTLSEADKQRRNNVEASIFQLVCYTRNRKTRYRGQFANQLWATARSTWINFRRIVLHVTLPETPPAQGCTGLGIFLRYLVLFPFTPARIRVTTGKF